MMDYSCTRCNTDDMGCWCKNCDENPYDRIKELEGELNLYKTTEWVKFCQHETLITGADGIQYCDDCKKKGNELLNPPPPGEK